MFSDTNMAFFGNREINYSTKKMCRTGFYWLEFDSCESWSWHNIVVRIREKQGCSRKQLLLTIFLETLYIYFWLHIDCMQIYTEGIKPKNERYACKSYIDKFVPTAVDRHDVWKSSEKPPQGSHYPNIHLSILSNLTWRIEKVSESLMESSAGFSKHSKNAGLVFSNITVFKMFLR